MREERFTERIISRSLRWVALHTSKPKPPARANPSLVSTRTMICRTPLPWQQQLLLHNLTPYSRDRLGDASSQRRCFSHSYTQQQHLPRTSAIHQRLIFKTPPPSSPASRCTHYTHTYTRTPLARHGLGFFGRGVQARGWVPSLISPSKLLVDLHNCEATSERTTTRRAATNERRPAGVSADVYPQHFDIRC